MRITLKRLLNTLISLPLLSFGAYSQAADLDVAEIMNMSGVVMVNQGVHFNTARPSMTLNAGDRLMTLADAQATVRFFPLFRSDVKDPKDCIISLPANSLLIVHAVSKCPPEAQLWTATPQQLHSGAVADAEPSIPLGTSTLVTCTVFECLEDGRDDDILGGRVQPIFAE